MHGSACPVGDSVVCEDVRFPGQGGTPLVKRTTALRHLRVSATGEGLVSRGGLVLLTETARVAGLERELRAVLTPWRRARAVHGPARGLTQLAFALPVRGGWLARIGLVP